MFFIRKKQYLSLIITLILSVLLMGQLGAGTSAHAKEQCCTALVGGNIITATGDKTIKNAVILINNGRIEAIGRRNETNIPSEYQTVDITGKWVTPGLIDTNVHLILTTVPEFFVKYEDKLEDIAIQSAQISLKYGMTTVADTWGPLNPLLAARDRINNGEIVGARVLVAGNIIGSGGPFTASFMQGWELNGRTIRYGGWVHPAIQERINAQWEDEVGPEMIAMTPDEVAETMRRYIAKGVDFIKVGVSGHSLGEVEPLVFSNEALQAMRKVTREAGIPFTTHTFSVPSLRQALLVKPDLLVHPNVMSRPWDGTPAQKKATLSMMSEIRDQGIYAGLMAIPNRKQTKIASSWDSHKHPDEYYLNRVMNERRSFTTMDSYKRRAKATKTWIDSGIKVTLATDQGPEAEDLGPTVWGRLGRAHFSRLEAMQELGMSPMDVIMAATKNGAEAYHLGKEVGTLEVGKRADILILDKNPLKDIANLRKIHMVLKDGAIINRQALPVNPILKYDPEATWPY